MLGRSGDSTELDEAGTAADRGRIGGAAKACSFPCGGYGRSN